MNDHASRVAAEIEHFRDQIDIHELPGIFHYWSQKWLGPHVAEVFGSSDLHGVLASELAASVTASGNGDILSIGAGDGAMEIGIAERLLNHGITRFRIECVELSPALIERGQALVEQKGLHAHVAFTEVDLTHWNAVRTYGAIFAHHSLHHIVALESVFDQAKAAMAPGAAFVAADMIGRNGHMRWPEVLGLVERIWSSVPERYRYHHEFNRQIDQFLNWDCAMAGFEGIRAQDILPLLVERFHFRRLCVWGGLTDMFIDRAYGHNLDPHNPVDTAFIDRLADAEAALLRAGAITPTVMVAVMTNEPGALVSSYGLTPEACIRRPHEMPRVTDGSAPPPSLVAALKTVARILLRRA